VNDDRRPVLVGVAQLMQSEVDPAEAPSPLDTLERIVRAVAEDAGVGEGVPRGVDVLGVVGSVGWYPRNAPRLLAERLGARPRREFGTPIGGEVPLCMVNWAARRIATGEVGTALVCGTHNLRTKRRARAQGIELDWEQGGSGEPERLGVDRPGATEAEVAYGLAMPATVYPIFENAVRARRGLDLETHRLRLGALMSRFTEVAAKNPYAWFPTVRSAEEIATTTTRNRMIAFPYTKYMNAVMEVDQAAGVLMTSVQTARALGISEDRWVYWCGGAETREERWYPSERPDFSRCQAMGDAGRSALAEAGVELGDLTHLDFYSCFPVAVEMACDMLGLDEDDPRGFTVTGGLPYAGGPGNNYTLHALATMVEKIRGKPGAAGLVTGNGWYFTKHTATVVSSAPREGDDWPAPESPAKKPETLATTASTDPAEGPATLESYTVLYDRDGAPQRGIVLGRTDEGRRFVANTPEDRQLLEAFVATEQVGGAGRLRQEEGRNVFDPA
jgi:acetyl-CoA C-acetyltransferase